MKLIKRIDMVDGKPVVLDTPVEIEFELGTLSFGGDARIWDAYNDYLTDEENSKVCLTADGISIDLGDKFCIIQRTYRNNKELADVIKSIISGEII